MGRDEASDAELLREYARSGSEAAFRSLAERYGPRVYSACLRRLGDPHSAEDAAQAVFLILMRKARTIGRNVVMIDWLLKTARNVVMTMNRARKRRARHEAAGGSERAVGNVDTEADWSAVRPRVDDALISLPRSSREAVLLHYLEGRSYEEVGRRLRCGPEAARKRITRGVEKLRAFLRRKGALLSAASLAQLLGANMLESVPAGLADSVSAACLGGGAAAAGLPIAEATLKALTAYKIKLVAAVTLSLAVVGGGGTLAVRQLAAAESGGNGKVKRILQRGAPVLSCTPARLGADETMASAQFQFVDFNGDGLQDIVQISAGGDRGWVFVNRGTKDRPYFDFYQRLPTNYSELHGTYITYAVDQWMCDFDGDGDLDVLLPSNKGLFLCVNTGDPWHDCLWTGKVLAKLGPGGPLCGGWDDQGRWNKWVITRKVSTLCAVDTDGDGKRDIYVQPTGGGLLLYRNKSAGGKYAVAAPLKVTATGGKPVWARSPFPIDFDGDGTTDLFSTAHGKGVRFLAAVKGKQGLVFKSPVEVRDEAGKPITGGNDVEILDWNADGLPDLMILDDSCAIRCHLGKQKGRPVFSSKPLRVHGRGFGRVGEKHQPQLRDVNRDGRSDLILGGSYDLHCSGGTTWMRIYDNVLPSGPCAFGRGDFVWQGALPLRGGEPQLCDFDGDGKLDVLYLAGRKGKQVRVALRFGAAADPRSSGEKPGTRLTITCGNTTYPSVRPMAADWNADGVTDLVLAARAYKWSRLYVCVNKGTSRAPKFCEPQEISAGGKVLTGGSPCIADWDRDGKLDLLLSGGGKGRPPLSWCRNLSKNKTPELAAPVEIKVGTPQTSARLSGRLSAGDLDGDGVLDLLVSRAVNDPNGAGFLWHSELWMLRGTAKTAPQPVRDLAVVGAQKNSARISWTAPAGATRCEVRVHARPIDEVTWFRARPAGRQPAASGGKQSFTVPDLKPASIAYAALCYFGSKGERSAVSNCVRLVTRPWIQASLVQGAPSKPLGTVAYRGCLDVQVRGRQDKSFDRQGLGAQSTKSANYCIDSYLQWDLAPLAGRKVKRAWLTLTAARSLAKWIPLRLREVKAGWNPKTVRYETRDGKTRWKATDYGRGAVECSPNHLFGLKRWDVTDLVLKQLAAGGKRTLNLHLNDAPLITGTGQHFHDSESKNAAARPALTVIYEQ